MKFDLLLFLRNGFLNVGSCKMELLEDYLLRFRLLLLLDLEEPVVGHGSCLEMRCCLAMMMLIF